MFVYLSELMILVNLGFLGVGKSSLLLRFADNTFSRKFSLSYSLFFLIHKAYLTS